jgi:EKC/KEOPS complex subunit CGI121/TPRKB
MDNFLFPHLPESHSLAQFALFRNVENTAALRKRIVSAATLTGPEGDQEREAVNFAFIDARLVRSFGS